MISLQYLIILNFLLLLIQWQTQAWLSEQTQICTIFGKWTKVPSHTVKHSKYDRSSRKYKILSYNPLEHLKNVRFSMLFYEGINEVWVYTGIFTAPQPLPPTKAKVIEGTPQSRRNYHPKKQPTPKILLCSTGAENGNWERKWVKKQFSIEIFGCKFQISIGFSPKRATFCRNVS